jgi:hypothetical protein
MASTFANTSEVDFAFIPETTFGTTPTDPAFQRFRITSESLTPNISNQTTNEIRPDAEVSDLVQTGASAGGDVGFELSYGSEMDTIFEHALRGSFNTGTLTAGTDKKSLSLEKKFVLDSSNDYFLRYTGARVGSLSLNMSSGSIITGSIGFQTIDEASADTIITNATYTDANTNDIMAAPDVASISIGSITGDVFLTDLSLNINNNLRNQNAIGNLFSVGIGYGLREVTGNMTVYFNADTKQIYDNFVAGTESSLSFDLTDGTNTYTVNLPRVKYVSGNVTAGGNNQDVFAEMQFQALYDSGSGTSIEVTN